MFFLRRHLVQRPLTYQWVEGGGEVGWGGDLEIALLDRRAAALVPIFSSYFYSKILAHRLRGYSIVFVLLPVTNS